MAIETAADLAYFFEDTEFGIDAVFTSPSLNVRGMIDNPREEIDLGIDAETITFTCVTADIPNVKEGSTLTIDGVNLTVVDRQDDGTGITELQLSKTTPSTKLFANNQDESVFFETDVFSVTVNFTSPALGQVVGILDTEVEELDVGGNTVTAEVPVLTVPTSLLVNVGEGSRLRYDSKHYQVKNRMDDGTGVTDLELFEFDPLDLIDNYYRPDGIGVYFQPDGESYYLAAPR